MFPQEFEQRIAFTGLETHDVSGKFLTGVQRLFASLGMYRYQRMLGHQSAATTLDVYGHLYTEDLEDLAARIDERISGVA